VDEASMIPFLDLPAQYRRIRHEIDPAIQEVVESCQFVLGPRVEALERDFAAYCEGRHAVAVNSGTSALHLALLAVGVGPGDEVVAPAMTFAATASAIGYTGARAVLVDVDPVSYNLAVGALEAAIGPRTRAIMPVHLYGQPADMDGVLAVARRHGLAVIEDACQAHGARYRGRRVGSLGDLGCFSFYPGKNLGAYGEGGMVVTDDDAHAHKLRMLRDWGQELKYHHLLRGFNYRMDGIQGAVLGVKLRHLDEWNQARRAHAARYSERLAEGPVAAPVELDYAQHVYHVYAVRVRDRDALRGDLLARGVQTGIHYPVPVHLHPAFEDLGYPLGAFPVAEQLAREELSLPMFAELTDEQIDGVVDALRECARPVR
jgi:dTDP-4-amino-4,6-dideoxygalactose transaminase